MTARILWLALTCLSGVISQTAAAADRHSLAAIYSQKDGKTASGEVFSPGKLTAAHRTLPFGTMVRVTNLQNGRTVIVRINDRGPFTKGRIIDLSPAAARQLGFSGLAAVTLDVITPGAD
jgi:rare lipoprotein A